MKNSIYDVKEGVKLSFDSQDGFLVFGFSINDFHFTDWVMMNIEMPEDQKILDDIAQYLKSKYLETEDKFYNSEADQFSRRKYMPEALYWPLSSELPQVT